MISGTTTIRFAPALLVVIAACADADRPEDAPPREPTIVIDTVRVLDAPNPDIDVIFGGIEMGSLLLAEEPFPSGTYLPLLDSVGNTVRNIGGPGDGSGSFTNIQMLGAYQSGLIHIFDRRHVVMLDSTFSPVRRIEVPFKVERGVVLADRSIVVMGDGLPDRHDFALHLIDSAGMVVRSFDPVHRGDFYSRFIAPGRASTVWSAPSTSDAPTYTIERWDPRTGQVLQTIKDSPAWFVAHGPDTSVVNGKPRVRSAPAPRVFDMWESPEGVLWIISTVTQADWGTADFELRERAVDGVLEARDAETGKLLATRHFDEYVTGFTSAGHAIMVSHDAQKRPRHVLFSFTLRDRQRTQSR